MKPRVSAQLPTTRPHRPGFRCLGRRPVCRLGPHLRGPRKGWEGFRGPKEPERRCEWVVRPRWVVGTHSHRESRTVTPEHHPGPLSPPCGPPQVTERAPHVVTEIGAVTAVRSPGTFLVGSLIRRRRDGKQRPAAREDGPPTPLLGELRGPGLSAPSLRGPGQNDVRGVQLSRTHR